LPFVPPPCPIAISSFIQCYLFYVHQCGKSCLHYSIPVAFMIIHTSNHLPIMCENMYNAYELFIPTNASGNLFYVIYLMLAWVGCHMLRWHSSYHWVHV
jgi:hypothetical protein